MPRLYVFLTLFFFFSHIYHFNFTCTYSRTLPIDWAKQSKNLVSLFFFLAPTAVRRDRKTISFVLDGGEQGGEGGEGKGKGGGGGGGGGG
jgi:uncharacterized membrane protein YgcG